MDPEQIAKAGSAHRRTATARYFSCTSRFQSTHGKTAQEQLIQHCKPDLAKIYADQVPSLSMKHDASVANVRWMCNGRMPPSGRHNIAEPWHCHKAMALHPKV